MPLVLRSDSEHRMGRMDVSDDAYDELAHFSETQATVLVSRGLIYLTDFEIQGNCRGTIIAANYRDAENVARRRGRGEKVIGRMADGFLRSFRDHMRWRG